MMDRKHLIQLNNFVLLNGFFSTPIRLKWWKDVIRDAEVNSKQHEKLTEEEKAKEEKEHERKVAGGGRRYRKEK